MPTSEAASIRRHALCLEQHPSLPVFLFSLTAREIGQVADVSRIARNENEKLVGYQRPEARRHVKNITSYLDSDEVLFPNSLILSFSSLVHFTPSTEASDDTPGVPGIIEIPVPREEDPRPGWIVDGQQRSIALAATKRQDLPVPVAAFVSDDVSVQRDQFLRVNSVKPLPNGLITELLPTLDTPLPPKLQARKAPSQICNRLARDPQSPFCGLIRRPSTPKAKRTSTVVKDTSLVVAIKNSLSSPSGCLFLHQNLATGEVDVEAAWTVLRVWWTAVRDTFPEAWGRRPRESRLMHSAGIRIMGRLMDRIMPTVDAFAPDAVDVVTAELAPLKSACCWTGGQWQVLDGLAWNDLQCQTRHVRLLTDYLSEIHARHFANHAISSTS